MIILKYQKIDKGFQVFKKQKVLKIKYYRLHQAKDLNQNRLKVFIKK